LKLESEVHENTLLKTKVNYMLYYVYINSLITGSTKAQYINAGQLFKVDLTMILQVQTINVHTIPHRQASKNIFNFTTLECIHFILIENNLNGKIDMQGK